MPGLLFVLAHPDDETFIAGGLIAKCAAGGAAVSLVCATRGERGATADLCAIDELPRVREAELREAGRILGIQNIEMLPYQDQKLHEAPPDEIRRKIVAAVRREKPEIAVTFDPIGANQHPDHVAISRFAEDALAAAADPRWYPETGPAHSVRRLLWPAPIPAFRLNTIPNVAEQPGIDILIDAGPYSGRKEAALRAHRTQFPGLSRVFAGKRSLSFEAFRVGWGPRPQSIPASDPFAE